MAKDVDGVQVGYYTPHFGNSRGFMANNATAIVAMNERMLMRRMQELSMNRFQWDGLPDEIDARFLEKTLFMQGLAVFCQLPEMFGSKHLALRASPTGDNDYQDNPKAFMVYGNDFYSDMIDADECVPIWSNTMRVPDHDIVHWYATRLAQIERTRDINAMAARHTRIVSANQDQRLTAANIDRQFQEGQTVIYTSTSFDPNSVQVFNLDLEPRVLSEVTLERNQLMNDCLTMLGITNSNQDKKERLVVDEVGAGDEETMMNRAIALGQRQAAAKRISKMFNLTVTVGWNELMSDDPELSDEGDNKERDGGNSGNVHDDAE